MRSPQHDARQTLARTVATVGLALAPALVAAANGGETAGNNSLADYRVLGLQAAMQTKAALGGELMQAMEAGGPQNAVAFCHTRALPITAAMSARLGMEISRVSDQPRNPVNAASDRELAIIAAFKDALAAGRPPAQSVRQHDAAVTGYYPIVTNSMCLNCHGREGVDISAATQAVIDSNYPDDQATGYSENELRGLFVVKMTRTGDDTRAMSPGSDGDE